MGIEILKEQFDERDYAAFSEKLVRSVEALRAVVERPLFGLGETSIGAELELDLVDEAGLPLPANRAVLATIADERVSLEVNRFNLEINSSAVPLAGGPFTALEGEIGSVLGVVRAAARAQGGDVVTIGILPTLRARDLSADALTDARRYRALAAGLRRARGEPFAVRIEGDEVLEVAADAVTFEGANTSLQVHLRVPPAAFADTLNAAQIATAFVVAVSGNSPFFLGRRLWHETRIALFRQSVDDRLGASEDDWRPARVSFGHGWTRRSAVELFTESVALHEPLLPQCEAEDPGAVVSAGGVPRLAELRLHHGTVWRWNRAVYDHEDGGHLRIEMRALPAGPTVRDMTANAALAIGLTRALAWRAEALVTQMTFGQARRNFYSAARDGLDAELLWPSDRSPSPRAVSVAELAPALCSLAVEGLIDGGVSPDEAESWIGIIRERVARRMTGAVWQRRTVEALERSLDRDAALAVMVGRYRALSEAGDVIHTWPQG